MKRLFLIIIGIVFFICPEACVIEGSAEGGDPYKYNEIGVKELEAGNYSEAIDYFERALKEDAKNTIVRKNLSVAYNNMALAYEARGDFENARRNMNKALKLQPENDGLKSNMSVLESNEAYKKYAEKESGEALRHARQAVFHDKENSHAYALMGQIYYDQDDQKLAKEYWSNALEIDPSLKVVKKKLEILEKDIEEEKNYRSHNLRHFKVKFEGVELWSAAWKVLEILEEAYRESGWKFEWYPEAPLTVIIYTEDKFERVADMPDWVIGVFDGKIRIKQKEVEGDQAVLRSLLFHEYTHAVLHHYIPNKIPVWLNEGMAQCYSDFSEKKGFTAREKSILKKYIRKGSLPSFDEVEKMFSDKNDIDKVRFAYVYSKAFVAYLIESEGRYYLNQLLRELKEGENIDEAFKKTYYRGLDTMKNFWAMQLEKQLY